MSKTEVNFFFRFRNVGHVIILHSSYSRAHVALFRERQRIPLRPTLGKQNIPAKPVHSLALFQFI